MSKNEDNTEPRETRYPFHGFYRPLLAEMEEIEAERAREQAAKPQLPESPTTTELPNTVSPAESASIKSVPQPALEAVSEDTISVPAQEDACLETAVPETPEEEPEPAENLVGSLT